MGIVIRLSDLSAVCRGPGYGQHARTPKAKNPDISTGIFNYIKLKLII